MMKNNNVTDERILAEKRKIQSRGYSCIIYFLLISIIVQQFFMNAPFPQYSVELLILIGCVIYNIVSSYIKGIDIWNSNGNGKKQILLNTFIAGIVSVILYAVLSGQYEFSGLGVYFVCFVISFFAFQMIMSIMIRKKLKKIDNDMDDDALE